MAIEGTLQFANLEPVGPGTPSGRYLRMFWQPVFRGKDLPAGKAKPIEILGEKFTVYRGADGSAHVVGFSCAHRGTQLSLGWVEGNDLRCRYHGWKFDADGQCNEQPNEDRPFCARVKIPTYPTREYLGLIFAYLGEGAPPKFRDYPDFRVPGVIVTDPPEIIPCSFWNRLDNDLSHIPWVHKATALRKGRSDYIRPRSEVIEETPYGWMSTRSVRGDAANFQALSKTNHWFMPNTSQFWHRNRAPGFERRDLWDTKITWTVPIDDQSFVAFDVTNTPLYGEDARAFAASRAAQEDEADTRWDLAAKVLAGEMTLEELPDELSAYTSFAIEDYVTQVGQGPIATRSKEHLGRTDAKPIINRRLWLREVTAMLEGRPLTDWQLPAQPLSSDPDFGPALGSLDPRSVTA
jgi:5,5'-dehydrodivanillate O-demethylase